MKSRAAVTPSGTNKPTPIAVDVSEEALEREAGVVLVCEVANAPGMFAVVFGGVVIALDDESVENMIG